jgi:CRISPR/Cas system-associated exonuclease Cas4 (RecB family)
MSERKDKLSGSGMAGYAACPGKHQLEITCPASESGPAAIMGNRIHSYLAAEKVTPPLNEEELEIAHRCQQEYVEILEAINLGEPESTTVEKRLWYGDAWSGQIDRIDHWGNTALMVDWKTGRVGTGNSAAENLQLRAYAVLLKKNFPHLTRILVAIVQPMAARYTIAEYEEIDLKLADEQIQGIVDAALAPNAPRTPSPDACRYCRAKAICPEAGGVVSNLATVPKVSVPALTNGDIGEFLEKAIIVEDFIEALRAEAKERLKAGQEIPGYKLSPGRTSRSIEDHQQAYSRISSVIGENSFISACKVSVPSLEKVFAASTGLKPKEAKAKLEELLGDALVTKTGDSVMSRAK